MMVGFVGNKMFFKFKNFFKKESSYIPSILTRYCVFYDEGFGEELIEITHPQGMFGVNKFMKRWYPEAKIKYIEVSER